MRIIHVFHVVLVVVLLEIVRVLATIEGKLAGVIKAKTKTRDSVRMHVLDVLLEIVSSGKSFAAGSDLASPGCNRNEFSLKSANAVSISTHACRRYGYF